jgi:putative transposase
MTKRKGEITMAQLTEKEMQLEALISEECTTPAALTAKLKNLFAGALEKMLEAEMDEHLGYEKKQRFRQQQRQ